MGQLAIITEESYFAQKCKFVKLGYIAIAILAQMVDNQSLGS